MPNYDYYCTACAHEFETFQSMKDDLLTQCPQCQGLIKRKIGGGTGIIFKGSGFYINDSKKSRPAEGESTSKPDAKPAGAPAETKSEPSAKSETKAAVGS